MSWTVSHQPDTWLQARTHCSRLLKDHGIGTWWLSRTPSRLATSTITLSRVLYSCCNTRAACTWGALLSTFPPAEFIS